MRGIPFISLALALSLVACGAPEPRPDTSGPNIGDTVLIMSQDGKLIPAAVSAEAYEALKKAFEAKDNEGISELMNANLAFGVQSGTTARYLDLEVLGPRLVRVLDGPSQGRKAWVSEEHIHAINRQASQDQVNAQATADPTRFLDTAIGSDSAKAFVRRNWDAILTTCPGLMTYAPDLTWGGLDDMSDPTYQANVRGIGYRLIVAERPTSIPNEFKAFGEHCSYRVTPDEQHLISVKTACTEVCLERKIPRQQNNLLIPLRHPN